MPNLLNIQTSAFKDVPDDSWAKGEIDRGQFYGIIKGIAPDTFGYGQTATREQVATWVVRGFERSAAVSIIASGLTFIAIYYLFRRG